MWNKMANTPNKINKFSFKLKMFIFRDGANIKISLPVNEHL